MHGHRKLSLYHVMSCPVHAAARPRLRSHRMMIAGVYHADTPTYLVLRPSAYSYDRSKLHRTLAQPRIQPKHARDRRFHPIWAPMLTSREQSSATPDSPGQRRSWSEDERRSEGRIEHYPVECFGTRLEDPDSTRSITAFIIPHGLVSLDSPPAPLGQRVGHRRDPP